MEELYHMIWRYHFRALENEKISVMVRICGVRLAYACCFWYLTQKKIGIDGQNIAVSICFWS
jgi:hypothetical protein